MTMPANTTPVRSITQQTGWKRPMPQTLCQDVDALLKVTDYSFDTSNRDFLRYFENRTGYYIGADPHHPQILSRIERGLMQPLPPGYFEMQCQVANNRDDNRIHRIYRAKLQDCWEIYTAQHPQPTPTTGKLDMFTA